MRRFTSWLRLGALALLLTPQALFACPSCRDAIPNTSAAEAEDQMREARAYNQSIYLMVSLPFVFVGAFGVVIYRGLKRQADFVRAQEQLPPPPPPSADPTDGITGEPRP